MFLTSCDVCALDWAYSLEAHLHDVRPGADERVVGGRGPARQQLGALQHVDIAARVGRDQRLVGRRARRQPPRAGRSRAVEDGVDRPPGSPFSAFLLPVDRPQAAELLLHQRFDESCDFRKRSSVVTIDARSVVKSVAPVLGQHGDAVLRHQPIAHEPCMAESIPLSGHWRRPRPKTKRKMR